MDFEVVPSTLFDNKVGLYVKKKELFTKTQKDHSTDHDENRPNFGAVKFGVVKPNEKVKLSFVLKINS